MSGGGRRRMAAPPSFGPAGARVAVVSRLREVPRVISDCHLAVQLNYFIQGFLPYSVAVFLTRHSDLSLEVPRRRRAELPGLLRREPGVKPPAQPGGPKVGTFH
jgi:hypothetical protein